MKSALQKSFEKLVSRSSPAEIERLREELLSGEVIRCRYSDESGHGCVVHILTSGIANTRTSRRAWYATFGADVLAASDDIVAAWDSHQLSPEMLLEWLNEMKPAAVSDYSSSNAEAVEPRHALAV